MKHLDATVLMEAKRGVVAPFSLSIERAGIGAIEITFLSILRLLPAKRIVALAEYDGEQVLVKMFLGRTSGKYAYRERSGALAIARSGVSTPDLMWEGEIDNGHLLVFHFLKDAISLSEQWEQAQQSDEKAQILDKAMKVLSQLHNHGVIQHDIHLGNFLLSEGRINTIDGGAVERKGEGALNEGASMRNLALFFAQFYSGFDELIDDVFLKYEQYREWVPDHGRLERLKDEVVLSRETRKKNYIDKSFRDCTRFLCTEKFSRFEVCKRSVYSEELAALMADPDHYIDAGTILKNGNTATVALVELSDRSMVVKRYNVKNPWHGLRRAFRRSRARQSWGNAHRMEFLGIPALRPIAMIEKRIGPITSTAYLITEFIEGPDALDCLKDMENPNGELESLTDILRQLIAVQISHGDLKATNFLMAEDGPVLIDLDGMTEHRTEESFKAAFGRDLSRFMENWEDYPKIRSEFSSLLHDMFSDFGVNIQISGSSS
ncbi:MAG: lipopolysaccharide kinase InaA family protein [Pseudomonadales bacterium]